MSGAFGGSAVFGGSGALIGSAAFGGSAALAAPGFHRLRALVIGAVTTGGGGVVTAPVLLR